MGQRESRHMGQKWIGTNTKEGRQVILNPVAKRVNIVSTKQTGGHYGNKESGAAQAQRRVES